MRKYAICTLAVAALVIGAAGCATKYEAERDGKDLGKNICTLAEASTQPAIEAAVSEVEGNVTDIASNYTGFTSEERDRFDAALGQLAKDAAGDDPAAVNETLASIQRGLDAAHDDVNDTDQALLDGIEQGLTDCTQ